MEVTRVERLAGARRLLVSPSGRLVAAQLPGVPPTVRVLDWREDNVTWEGRGWLAGPPDGDGQVHTVLGDGEWSLRSSSQPEPLLRFALPEWTAGALAEPRFVGVCRQPHLAVVAFEAHHFELPHRSWLATFDVTSGEMLWQLELDRDLERWSYAAIELHPSEPLLFTYLATHCYADPRPEGARAELVDIRDRSVRWSRELPEDSLEDLARFSATGKCVLLKQPTSWMLLDVDNGETLHQLDPGMVRTFDLVPLEHAAGLVALLNRSNPGGLSSPFEDYELCTIPFAEPDSIYHREVLVPVSGSDRPCPRTLALLEQERHVLVGVPSGG